MNSFVFIGVQLFSVILAATILFEYWRVCRKRAQIFERLGSSVTGERMQYLLTTFYILTTLLIMLVSSAIFIRQSSFL